MAKKDDSTKIDNSSDILKEGAYLHLTKVIGLMHSRVCGVTVDMDDMKRIFSRALSNIQWMIGLGVLVVVLFQCIILWDIGDNPQRVCHTETKSQYYDMSSETSVFSMIQVTIPTEEGYEMTDISCFGSVSYTDYGVKLFIERHNAWSLPCEKDKCGCVVTISKEVCRIE